MFTLSMRKPYADLVMQGRKTIEIRHWSRDLCWPQRIIIHTSKQLHEAGVKEFGAGALPAGMLVGTVIVSGIKRYTTKEEFDKDRQFHLADGSFYKPSRTFGYLLTAPKLLDLPIPCKGQLGFFQTEILLDSDHDGSFIIVSI